jgi:hypothetical protein
MVLFTLAGLLQGLVCLQYINRMSDDRPVIAWYFVVLVIYATAAAFFYFKWIKERKKERGTCTGKK